MNKKQETFKKIDEIEVSNTYLDFHSRYYSYSKIDSLPNAKLVSYTDCVSKLLNMQIDEDNDAQLVKLLNGELLLKNSKPYSMVYAGHQFGHFVPQLGDGRAINLGWDALMVGIYNSKVQGLLSTHVKEMEKQYLDLLLENI